MEYGHNFVVVLRIFSADRQKMRRNGGAPKKKLHAQRLTTKQKPVWGRGKNCKVVRASSVSSGGSGLSEPEKRKPNPNPRYNPKPQKDPQFYWNQT